MAFTIVNTRPRVVREAAPNQWIDGLTNAVRLAIQNRAEKRREATTDRRRGEDAAQARLLAGMQNDAAMARLKAQESGLNYRQGRGLVHDTEMQDDAQDFTGTQNKADRDLRDRISQRSDNTQRYGIDQSHDLGMRRLGVEAIQVGGLLQHYRNQDARPQGGEYGPNRLLLTPGNVTSIINGVTSIPHIAPDEVMPTARTLVDSAQAWALRPVTGGQGAAVLTPPDRLVAPRSSDAQAPPPTARDTPQARMTAPRGVSAAPSSAAADSMAEQAAHWDAAAAALRSQGVQDVEGRIGPRPRGAPGGSGAPARLEAPVRVNVQGVPSAQIASTIAQADPRDREALLAEIPDARRAEVRRDLERLLDTTRRRTAH